MEEQCVGIQGLQPEVVDGGAEYQCLGTKGTELGGAAFEEDKSQGGRPDTEENQYMLLSPDLGLHPSSVTASAQVPLLKAEAADFLPNSSDSHLTILVQ